MVWVDLKYSFQGTGPPAGRPVVPLSRDKNISLSGCPFVSGQTPLFQDVPGQNQYLIGKKLSYKRQKKKIKEISFFSYVARSKTEKGHSKTGKDVLKQKNDVLK